VLSLSRLFGVRKETGHVLHEAGGARATSEAQQPQQQELDALHPEQRVYTWELKVQAMLLSESSDKTVAQMAGDLGVPERMLYHWRYELRERGPLARVGV
jgi:Transposase